MEQSYPSAPGERTQRSAHDLSGQLGDRTNEGRGDGHGMQEQAGRLAHEAKERAASAVDHVRESAGSALRSQKETTAERLQGVAGSFRDVGERLHEQEDNAAAQLVDFAAEQIDCWSKYLRQRDLGELKLDAENLARRHPSIFLGGAFVAGLALGRFMRSSAPRYEQDMEHDRQPVAPPDRSLAGSGPSSYRSPTYTAPPYGAGSSGIGSSGLSSSSMSGAGPGGAAMTGQGGRSPGSPGMGATGFGPGRSGIHGGEQRQGESASSRPQGSSSPGSSGPAGTGKPLSDERSSTPPGNTNQPNRPHGTGAP